MLNSKPNLILLRHGKLEINWIFRCCTFHRNFRRSLRKCWVVSPVYGVCHPRHCVSSWRVRSLGLLLVLGGRFYWKKSGQIFAGCYGEPNNTSEVAAKSRIGQQTFDSLEIPLRFCRSWTWTPLYTKVTRMCFSSELLTFSFTDSKYINFRLHLVGSDGDDKSWADPDFQNSRRPSRPISQSGRLGGETSIDFRRKIDRFVTDASDIRRFCTILFKF